jgi:hypothetical protein
MKTKHYMNCNTGEITYDHKEAVEWFRTGANIKIINDDGSTPGVTGWEH